MLEDLEGWRIDDRYQLEKLIGKKIFSAVYLADDLRADKQVAIRVMNSSMFEVNEFVKEIQKVMPLSHPHINPLHGFRIDERSRRTIIIMEYVSGGSLRERHKPDSLVQLDIVVSYVQQIASALQYAHVQGVVHRDIKPQNVLIASDKRLLLTDFGMAMFSPLFKRGNRYADQMRGGNGGSTFLYMAPEQWQGQYHKASDQYSLAVMLYEWLRGTCPFNGPTENDFQRQHTKEKPPPLREFNPSIPVQVEAVIMKALAKSPQDRFPTISDFASALETASHHNDSEEQEDDDDVVDPLPSPVPVPVPEPDIIPFPTISQRPIQDLPPSEDEEADSSPPPVVPIPMSEPANAPPVSQHSGNAAAAAAGIGAAGMATGVATTGHTVGSIAGSPPARGATGVGGAGTPPRQPRRRRDGALLLALVALLLLTLLVCGSIALAAPNSPIGSAVNHLVGAGTLGATVTIVPTSQTVSGNFAILAVIGTPNGSQREVQARQLSYTTPVQSRTVNSTGIAGTPGTRATGILTFYNGTGSAYMVAAGTKFTDAQGVEVENSSVAAIPAGNPLSGYGRTTVAAVAVQVGTSGNIRASDFNLVQCCGNSAIYVSNTSAFSGGQDPQHYTGVQQSDVDNVANPLINPTEQNALNTLKGQRHTNEQFVGQPKCAPNVNANPPVGSKSQTVTVSVSASCGGEVYDHSSAVAMAVTSLQNQASKVPGAAYKLVGQIVPTITQLAVVDARGTISLIIHAEGIWEYNFDKTQEVQLVGKIVGKTQSVAQTILAGQTGVAKVVSISLASGNTLPTNPTQIHFVIQDVPGLSGTPVSSGSPTTITPTSGPGTPQPGSG